MDVIPHLIDAPPLRSGLAHRQSARRIWTSLALALAGVLGCSGASGEESGLTEGTESGSTSGDSGDSGGSGDFGLTRCSFQDDFATLDPEVWIQTDASGMQAESVDGRLTFSPVPNWTDFFWVRVRRYGSIDLTQCAAWVEVPSVLPEGVLGDVTWDLGLNVDAYAMIRVVQPDIQFIINDTNLDELSESSVPYDPAAHRWWRYRDEAGVIYLETSPDLDTWTVQLERPHTWELSGGRMIFSTSLDMTTETFEAPQFDNLNVVP